MSAGKNRAFFTTVEDGEKKKFINSFSHYSSVIRKRALNFKRFFKISVDKSSNLINKLNYRKIFTEMTFWFVETFIEGLTANYATHTLFNLPFNVPMIIAHGIIIKQSLSIIQRVVEIKNGPNNKLPTEKHSD